MTHLESDVAQLLTANAQSDRALSAFIQAAQLPKQSAAAKQIQGEGLPDVAPLLELMRRPELCSASTAAPTAAAPTAADMDRHMDRQQSGHSSLESSRFIRSPNYGTRSSSLVAISPQSHLAIAEMTYAPAGPVAFRNSALRLAGWPVAAG